MKKSKNKNLAKLKKLCEKRDSIAEENERSCTSRETIKEAADNFLIRNKEGSFGDVEKLRDVYYIKDEDCDSISRQDVEKCNKAIATIMDYNEKRFKKADIAVFDYIFEENEDGEYILETCCTIQELIRDGVSVELKERYDLFLENYAYCYQNKGEVNAVYAYCQIEFKRFCSELKEQKNEKRKE